MERRDQECTLFLEQQVEQVRVAAKQSRHRSKSKSKQHVARKWRCCGTLEEKWKRLAEAKRQQFEIRREA
jgi:hypothetical protein